MNGSELAAVVLAGGLGTRMRSSRPKHLHPLLGRRLVDWVIETGRALDPALLVVVSSPDYAAEFDGVELAVQEQPLGTGDALASAKAALGAHTGEVLVLSGDSPLLRPETLSALLDTHRQEGAAATVLTFRKEDPGSYGRVIRDGGGSVRAIVEATDASPEQLAVDEVNSSIYVFRGDALWPALERLDPANAQGELYLTDAVRLLVDAGERVVAHEAADPTEPEGVNTRVELAAAAAALRDRINEAHMLAGVTIVDPATTWIEPSVEIEADAVIAPFTVLNGQTRVGEGAAVGPHVVAVDASIGARVLVGPFCYLRPGTVLEAGSKAGTFVEIKNSRVGEGTKVPHLSYIGDADIAEGTNVGAGNITANFAHRPGQPKGRTTIGRNVRTGVHNAFVAPVEIGHGAWVAAGSVITKDVPPGALAIARSRQENKEGYAGRGPDGTERVVDDDD
ncbi:MAG TPA: bifunctional UDP-N-acetylglucosamine diphosphorylase/glucosamine-1-phosphate N-acetyltransferase GlmU [Gaiellaceae bacterium]|nr:bifunctional UDP-N-acetylglucosamine diphosphorylase/glucosamine-1-phosphate N-acetyltransferase GlmU [Gaiellaceae bacterium]